MYKVVVVEDEKLVRSGIVHGTNWSQINCMVAGEAADGEEGIEAAKKYHPDVIITDVCMPKMDGIEMVKHLREEGIEAVVIFLTAYDEFRYAQQAVRLGAADYLLKPFEDGALEEAVAGILAKNKKDAAEMADTNELNLAKGDKSKYIMEAIAYIDENYANPKISVKTAAESLGISEGHLSHFGKKRILHFYHISRNAECAWQKSYFRITGIRYTRWQNWLVIAILLTLVSYLKKQLEFRLPSIRTDTENKIYQNFKTNMCFVRYTLLCSLYTI